MTTLPDGPSAELLETFVPQARERVQHMKSSLDALIHGTTSTPRRRLLGQLREEAHAVRGAASACGLDSAAAAAGRLETIAAGLHEDDLEVGVADRRALRSTLEALAAEIATVPFSQPRGAPTAPDETGVETILCIDDDATSRALVRLLLRARPGARLLEAADAESGLELARSERPDLIVLDLRLPDLPGRDVLVALGTSPETRDIPVLLLSGDEPPDVAAAYLRKPIDPAVFLSVVDDLVARQPVQQLDTSHLEAADGVRPLR